MRLVYWPDERLTQPTRAVGLSDSEELDALEAGMRHAMEEEHGIGIAATQVGSDLRVCLVKLDLRGPGELMINPKIVGRSKRAILGEEGVVAGVAVGAGDVTEHAAGSAIPRRLALRWPIRSADGGWWFGLRRAAGALRVVSVRIFSCRSEATPGETASDWPTLQGWARNMTIARTNPSD